MRKIYTRKSKADTRLLDSCRELCDAIRSMIGDNRYRFACEHERDDRAYAIKERQEYYVVGTAALIYGSARAFIDLASSGLEREAIQFQRHVLEYYFLARYYSNHAVWCFVHWAQSVKEEAEFLESVIAHHGSRQKLMQAKRDASAAAKFLSSIPKEERQHIRPSIEALARQYAVRESDYTMLYRWPSQITHATFLGLNWGWMSDSTPRFDSDVSNINARAAMVMEYLLLFVDVLGKKSTVKAQVDLRTLRQQLKAHRTRLKLRIHKPVAKRLSTRRRAA